MDQAEFARLLESSLSTADKAQPGANKLACEVQFLEGHGIMAPVDAMRMHEVLQSNLRPDEVCAHPAPGHSPTLRTLHALPIATYYSVRAELEMRCGAGSHSIFTETTPDFALLSWSQRYICSLPHLTLPYLRTAKLAAIVHAAS